MKTKESQALAAAIKRSGMRQRDIAERVDVDPSMVSQWATGHRPVAPEKAVALARLLDIPPAAISTALRGIQSAGAGGPSPLRESQEADQRDYSEVIRNLENDVHALNLAIVSLMASMTIHRPTEAADLSQSLKRKIPAQYRDRGLLKELIALLDRAARKQ